MSKTTSCHAIRQAVVNTWTVLESDSDTSQVHAAVRVVVRLTTEISGRDEN
jgi:hypothetical protein